MKQEQTLVNQFNVLEKELQNLRQQQKAIVMLLEQKMLTKSAGYEWWRMLGLTKKDMKNWHKQFEKMESTAHQEFLESLNIDEQEVASIREWSKK